MPTNLNPKGKSINDFISTLFSTGLHKPAGALLAGCLIATVIGGWPLLVGLPIVIFSIYIVVSSVSG